ncbi:MAG: hypothetical protein HC836_48170 [Richelia sp. RM2_1_2]|nr:hypothetical protein [Richelia sp. SM2_1_7]NJN13639.1 hypothetical protein [Richelia sp. RM1_1_1]NJO31582.1 hypothetical protein [Richelia sp. SL_2_1]NJO65591.1 hypothetical protein [Richelia sp. RM2_1_2]
MKESRTEKVMFTCTPDVKEYLIDWATNERRSVSNLVEGLVVEAITQKKSEAENETSSSAKKDKRG